MRFIYLVGMIAACSGLLFGYDTGAISGAILFIKQEFSLSPILVGIVTSVVLAGASAGALVGGWVADRFGRRHVILGTAVVFVVGSGLSAVAMSVGWLIGARVIVGIAIGIASFVAPMYLSEIAPPEHRGSMVALNQLALTFGILCSYVVDFAFSGSGDWRAMLGVGIVPALALLAGMFVVPDTPRWLMLRGREQDAIAALKRVREPEQVDPEIKETRESLAEARKTGYGDLLRPRLRMPMIVGIGLAILQQVTGINTVIYYAPTIFHSAGIASSSNSIFASLSVGVVNFLMTIVAVVLIDRVGRRPLLLIGEIGMVISLVVLAIGFTFHGAATGWITAASLVCYVGSFAIGLGPVFWLLIAEIYPLRVRGLAMSVATVANWVANLVITLTFPELVAVIGPSWTFVIYAVVGVFSLIFTWRLVPETRGKTLEQIEDHWLEGKHPRALRTSR
jgi:sugar porter (SP) family MFS transporter